MVRLYTLVMVVLVLTGCQQVKEEAQLSDDLNPAAEGFDFDHSDPAAIELADSVMKAQGGRRAWDETRYLSWNFNNERNYVWDKHESRIRIESLPDSTTYLLNLKTREGRIRVKRRELTEADSLKKMLERAEARWTNDSYWLLMPYKLKDRGVTLKFLGEDSLATGGLCNVLQVTFKNADTTSESKYLVYVDRADNLVKQWAYFEQATQSTASFMWPFDNYKTYGKILLSADRSNGRGPRDVRADENLPETLFTDF